MDMCPAGFKDTLDELGILTCEKKVARRNMIVFEATEELIRPNTISMSDMYLVSVYKTRIIALLIKTASIYKDARVNALSAYEAFLLNDWLGLSVGMYVPIKYENKAL